MNKFSILIAATMAAVAIPSVASAATPFGQPYGVERGWQNINARQAQIEMKINQGIRSGSLTRGEAMQLRAEFRGISMLEARYRASRPGLTMAERADLDRRFNQLERKVMVQKHDRDNRGHGRRW